MAFISKIKDDNTCRVNAQRGILSFLLTTILLMPTISIHGADFKPKVLTTILTTNDGWQIPITYYQSELREQSPVLIFLHGSKGNRLNWDDLIAPEFNKSGYTVITVDLRKHGKSKPSGAQSEKRNSSKLKNIDYKLMVAQDLEAVKDFIYLEHQKKNLNMRKIAIIATDMSAPLALVFAYRDWMKPPYDDGPTLATRTPRGQDVRALVLISPDESLPGINAKRNLGYLKDSAKKIAILTVVGSKDLKGVKQAEKIYLKLDGKKGDPRSGRFQLRKYKTKYRGYNLIKNNYDILDQAYQFLEEYLKPINDPWRNRENNYSK